MARDVKIILKTVSDLTGLTRLHRAVRDNIPGVKTLEGAFGKLTASVGALGRIGGRALKGLSASVGVLTAAMAANVAQQVKFNAGLARAWTMMSGVGLRGIMGYRQQLTDMSADIGVARDQLVNGLYDAISAGVPQDNAITFLSDAAKIAVVDGSSVSDAVNGLTGVLNTYGIEATEAGRVSDLLFSTVKNGKTTFGQLSQSIAQAAPTAAAMGVEIEQLLAAYASLTQQNIPTSTAMVMIRNSLLSVNEELGDGWASAMTFQEALQKIATEAGGSSNALTKIFGRETVAGVQALTGANYQAATDTLQALGNAAGTTAEMLEKRDILVGPWEKFKQQVFATFSTLGSDLEEQLRPTFSQLNAWLAEFRKGDTFKQFSRNLAEGIGNAVKNLIAGIGTAAAMAKRLVTSGPESIGAALKVLVEELVTLAASTLIEFLRANINFFMTLGKVIAGAFRAEILKMDIPGINDRKRRTAAATESLQNMTYQDLVDRGLLNEAYLGAGGIDGSARVSAADARRMTSNMTDNTLAEVGGMTGASQIMAALNQGRAEFADSRARLGAQFNQSMARVSGTFQTGFGFDPVADYNNRRAQIDSMIPTPDAGAIAPEMTPAAKVQQKAAYISEYRRRQMAREAERSRMPSLTEALMQRQENIRGDRPSFALPSNRDARSQQEARIKRLQEIIDQLEEGNKEFEKTLLQKLEKLGMTTKDLESKVRALPF